MTKKHEELVEEITEFIALCVRDSGGITRYSAEDIITHILSAVRDGRLDEELGVVGRGKIVDGFMVDWDDKPVWKQMDLDCRFIALRPLTGTGKEETKNADSPGQRD